MGVFIKKARDEIDYELDWDRETSIGNVLPEGMTIHPLYFEYDRIYQEDLSFFSTITSLDQAVTYLDDFIGVNPRGLKYR
jgi:hypothetical protein